MRIADQIEYMQRQVRAAAGSRYFDVPDSGGLRFEPVDLFTADTEVEFAPRTVPERALQPRLNIPNVVR